ncbi:competence type IV pilus minor pilin ComGF [Sediminibacillus halophilus]|uniref:Competence protein ComGF n=1 Tax=Sediminibacillus halophilus TaxID=482461 RepID=A0A1G9YEJ0_9BACI|nr:ComGF family competence protein [Sediminibacillus halophilus]SDN07628.1 competence protein ComGF [Sediminibacillus halophilus]
MKFVFMLIPQNSKGFTLLSLLFGLAILLMVLPCVGIFYQSLSMDNHYQEQAVRLAFQFLADQSEQSVEMQVSGNTLLFEPGEGSIISISQYEDLLRRQVAGEGHEILLRDVSDFAIEQLTFGLKITVMMDRGEQYEKIIPYP